MTAQRYKVAALAVFNGDIDQFLRDETVELRDGSRWKCNLDYTCFYCIRTAAGEIPVAIITRGLK